MTKKEEMQTPEEVQLAIGRIFRMMSRPFEEGDIETFSTCRSVILNASQEPRDDRPNWARDRMRGDITS